MAKAFASQADLADKQVTFARLSENAYAYTTEGDPNTGIVIGDGGVMVIDTQATPAMAQDVIRHIRQVTDEPIKYVVLSHYHAVRVLGASAYQPQAIIASQATLEMIRERIKQSRHAYDGLRRIPARDLVAASSAAAAPESPAGGATASATGNEA
jgi:glyoxylase-like metal-dependent hydrolase (beta-lactamase superfamily II)